MAKDSTYLFYEIVLALNLVAGLVNPTKSRQITVGRDLEEQWQGCAARQLQKCYLLIVELPVPNIRSSGVLPVNPHMLSCPPTPTHLMSVSGLGSKTLSCVNYVLSGYLG
ncbi:hypothetical protein J6590_055407 [Homalodisca vitripennis]|nr:hypothetical protein J6590_055407 [Homalodisca vitripennis]